MTEILAKPLQTANRERCWCGYYPAVCEPNTPQRGPALYHHTSSL